ncbi:MAG: peptidase [Rhodospirillales bacterium]|jgi:predicted acyl esterase|nr:peptidase [Rhodospirillales bacterium]
MERREIGADGATRPLTMRLDKDVAVPMRVGDTLRANIFRPEEPGRYPVLVTLGPYGKDVHISQFMPSAWEQIEQRHPEILAASSCKHLVFETPDPEVWVPHGYVVMKVDSRGAGKSPGFLDVNSPSESRDLYDAIEWAAAHEWSNGKVGLLGISYYAAGQWMVAALRPPHLAAILPWQGTFDFYRDRTRQDGIFAAGFTHSWWPRSVLRNQHGNPESPFLDIVTGARSTGPASFSKQELAANRTDYIADVLAHPLRDDWYKARSADLSKVDLPALVVANWGGLGLHLRGTIAGYDGIASPDKWLKIQSGSYFITFLQPKNIALQRRFFDRYLKSIDNGWEREPRVTIEVRSHDDGIAGLVEGTQWPLPETEFVCWHLDAADKSLGRETPRADRSLSYQALSDGATFVSPSLAQETWIAGPVRLTLWASSDTVDMDVFATLRAFSPAGDEVTFLSAIDPKCPISQGWLRASHRKLDAALSTEYRPVHTHDEVQPLVPGDAYRLDIEIWPTSVALPAGYRLALTVQGKDFERADEPGPFKGSGFFTHESDIDRPPAIFGGTHTLHTGAVRDSVLFVPVLPRHPAR